MELAEKHGKRNVSGYVRIKPHSFRIIRLRITIWTFSDGSCGLLSTSYSPASYKGTKCASGWIEPRFHG